MAFDPSVISTISDRAAVDVAGDQAKALSLADLYDTRELRRGQVVAQKQEQSDMTYARQILSGKDLSKLEDQNEAVAQITQRNPNLGMQLMKSFQSARAGEQDLQKGKMDLDRSQLELYNIKNDIQGGMLTQLKLQHDDLIAKGMTEEQVDQQMRAPMFKAIEQMVAAKLPNGQPLLNQQDVQFIQQNFAQGYNPQAVDSLVARSAQAKQAIAQHLAERKDARAEQDEDRKERATNAAIAQGKARTAMAETGKIEPDDATFMAQQYLAGDKSIFTGLGRGVQGAANIIMVRRAIREEATRKGMNPTDVAARLAEYNGFVSEQRAMGTQQANTEMASSEAEQMIQNARQASADVPRGSFLPWTKLSQMTDKQLNDPKLASLKAATTAVINTWSRAINPKGVATVADKEHGYELLNAAQDQDAYNAVLDRFEQEAQASLAAPASAKQRLHDAFVGSQSSTAAGAGAAQAPPLKGIAPAAAGTPAAAPGRGAPAAGGPAAVVPPPPPGFQLQP